MIGDAERPGPNEASLCAHVVDRLAEAAQVARLRDYLDEYQPTDARGISLEDAVSAVREAREAS